MLHRLCGPPSIPLSFNLAAVLPRRCTYRVSFGTEGVESPHTQCTSFTARTTGVSNPVRSPGFRPSGSVAGQRAAFAAGVPPDIYAFHRYTGTSTLLSCTPVWQFPVPFPGWARTFHTRLAKPPTDPLRPVNPNNARHPRVTAAAGTELAVASSPGSLNSHTS